MAKKGVKVKIKDNRTVFDKMIKTVIKLAKEENNIEAGIFGNKGSAMVVSASTNEFGTDKAGPNRNIVIPERSFLRSTLIERAKIIRQMLDDNKVDIVLGKMPKRKILNRLGFYFVGEVQMRIANREILPVNAPSTIKAKGSTTPLIDKGRMRGAIAHRLVK